MPGGPALDPLRKTVSALVALTASAPARDVAHAQRGEWSAAQVVAHMADAEMVYGVRVRLILTEDNPTLTAYDQDAWAERLGVCDPNVAASVERFRLLRDTNLRLYESLEPEEWMRTGVHVETGLMTIKGAVESLIGHDRTHLDQIRRLLP